MAPVHIPVFLSQKPGTKKRNDSGCNRILSVVTRPLVPGARAMAGIVIVVLVVVGGLVAGGVFFMCVLAVPRGADFSLMQAQSSSYDFSSRCDAARTTNVHNISRSPVAGGLATVYGKV